MSGNAEEYLEKKVRGIIEPMVSALLLDRPKEPVKISFKNKFVDAFHDRMVAEFRRFEIIRPKYGAH